ncbi:DUF3095 family protein [Breoghania sp. L-A4]|uniref:DUF3095 family protein n=1 Tax=Breoghania sp. L-A4 TaxID=2304600 RepID=UPI000E35A94D|nr:DUF3095 family protein [Breoghania sp. L-A4]AXS39583.1 DUF3095 family protein [Breoghania sp. L-A4]
MPSDDFYLELKSFAKLSALGELAAYEPVPTDWVVLVADIVRSGEAVKAGRYKQVNLVGAAVISAVLNKLGRDRIPFIFGGDGAVLLVPARDAQAGADALAGVADMAARDMDLELRHAAIPVAHLRAQGTDVRLRKYALSPGNFLAMAVGGGLELADRILKDPALQAPFRIERPVHAAPLLEGLSCRWDPVPSRRGRIVSLILRPSADLYLSSILAEIQEATGFNPLSEAPEDALVQPTELKFRLRPSSLAQEIRLLAAAQGLVPSAVRVVLQSFGFLWGYMTGLRIGPFEAKRYLDELSRNTDHRKLDDSLRLVLDLSPAQLDALTRYLAQAYDAGRLVYGLHVSDAALMTCFVTDIADGRHIHFIDGGDGGLSMAGADYKRRAAQRAGA